MSNIALGPPGQREDVEAAGAAEALEDAIHDCDGLHAMTNEALVKAMDESHVRPFGALLSPIP